MTHAAHCTRTYLLTGVTGFLGKVLLAELMRRRSELSLHRVIVVIRPLGALCARDRFAAEVLASSCFSHLPRNWSDSITVLEADLEAIEDGMFPELLTTLASVTHIIHCAALVQFRAPGRRIARANVDAVLSLLDVARSLPLLQRFVHVSTAYVATPGGDALIEELPITLPAPASVMYAQLLGRSEADADIVGSTGFANHYTLSKAIAECLLMEQRGHVRVTIIRPSIITASRRYPSAGWIDSASGFAEFVLLIGTGQMCALVCDPHVRLDLIPVDEVSKRIVDASMSETGEVKIVHAVAGAECSPTIGQCWAITRRYFSEHRLSGRTIGRYLGPDGMRFRIADFIFHRVLRLHGESASEGNRRRAVRRYARIAALNREFAYFTTRTFRFATSSPLDRECSGHECVRLVGYGVHRHLLDVPS